MNGQCNLFLTYCLFSLISDFFSAQTILRRMKGPQVNDEQEKIRPWPNFKVLFRYSPGRTEESHEKPPVRISGLRDEI
jgi:hypothetical protein